MGHGEREEKKWSGTEAKRGRHGAHDRARFGAGDERPGEISAMAEAKCPKCGARVDEGSPFCLNCGATLRGLRIVDMRPTIEPGSRVMRATGSGERPEVHRTRTSYRSGILEAKSALERNRGIPPTRAWEPPPEDTASRTAKRDRTVWMVAAIAVLLLVLLIILVVLIVSYI